MKTISLAVTFLIVLSSFGKMESKLISKATHISFYSHTAVEDIEANNYKVVSTLETTTGDIVFSVPMQSFEFEKSLMQKHYNGSNFLDTQTYPKAKLIGKIDNLANVNFSEDGVYEANVSGSLTIKDKTNPISEKVTITVKGGVVTLDSKMNLTLSEFGVTFSGGKPSKNIAKDIEVTVKAVYNN